METYCKELASQLGLTLTESQMEKLFHFKDMLLEANQYMNLTAIVEDKEIIVKHFIDSLSIHSWIEDSSEKSLIDVGTGAGFPGIPLKIVKENLKITLLDSLQKRLGFLDSVIDALSLSAIETVHGRAEDCGKMSLYREKYDYVTARAVANLSTLSELCLPFVKVGGLFLCMKAGLNEELENAQKVISLLGGEVTSVQHFQLPDTDIERNIIVIQKKKPTPNAYPRKAGLPAKEPIK